MNINYERVCRLCLSSRAETLPVFSSTSSDLDSTVLATKIEACVSVQICKGDALPTQVCKKCVDNVNNWHTFKEICGQAQVRLGAWLKQLLENGSGQETEENVEVKAEPEEGYGGPPIDASYPEFEQINAEKLQPEGPPILASLGLAPRQDKGVVRDEEEEELEEEEEEEEDETDPTAATFPDLPGLPGLPEVSVTVMRPTGAALSPRRAVQQLACKNCLVCGRTYRYSHNARRHELTSHNFDRYTNRVKDLPIKLRPNPFNPKARLVPNPINPKIQLSNKSKSSPDHSFPYPLRIKAISDLQIKMKEPEILKTLLTAQPEKLVSQSEIINSGSESPETLISEPEIASFQVEAIISEPDAFQTETVIDEDEGVTEPMEEAHGHCNVNIEGGREMEIALKVNGAVQPNDTNHEEIDVNGEVASEDENDAVRIDEDSTSSSLKMMIDEEHPDTNDGLLNNVNGLQTDGPDAEEDNIADMEDEDLPPMTLAPIVEINEELPANSFDSELGEEEEDVSGELNESIEPKEDSPNDKICVTKTQRDFIVKYRNIIEQINTKKCLCCDRTYPRRKAVIQHLQKSGHIIPKYTCYNCVVTFGHIGALLSHMRANICTNLWKLIYKEDGVTDDMIVDEVEAEIPESQYGINQGDTLNKGQYKDILNARSYACRLCPAKFQLKQFIMKHVLDVHEDGQSRVPLACVHCGYRFKENRLWKKHVRNGECTVNIACDLCPEKFMNMLEFNEHALAVHAGGYVDQDNSSKCVDGRPTDCPICHKNTSSYHNLVKHLKSVHYEEKPHYCQHCDSKYEVISDLNQHIYLKHSDRSAASEMPDMSIVKEETEEYHYSCTECNGIFETVDAWTEHQIVEHGQTAFPCDQCEKKFLQQSDLEKHKSSHLRVKLYSCPQCPNSYGSVLALSEHTASVHADAASASSEDPFFCTTCKRGFKSRQAFSNHMRIHSRAPTHNKRPPPPASAAGPPKTIPWAVAQIGGYLTFKNSYNNIPNAPYSCDICGKGFMHKKNIWKHKKVLHPEVVGNLDMSEENTMHTAASTEDEEFDQGENGTGLSIPQFDNFGSAGFANSAGASLHPLVFHQCDLCVKKFTAKASLWKHKRVKHGIINPNPNESNTPPGDTGRSSCTICKISFADKKSYYRHRKNVHKSNIQMCKICGKPLNSTLELYEHLKAAHARELLGYNATQGSPKIHPQQKVKTETVSKLEHEDGPVDAGAADGYQARYPCETCGKYFLGMLALQNHQCVNRDPTPEIFNCEICNKTYTSISALKSHRGWHLRSPDGKAAANNSGLWMPQNRVTNKSSKFEVNEEVILAMQPTAPIDRFIHSTPNNTLQVTKRKLPPEVEVTVVNPNKKARPEPTPTPPALSLSGLLTGEDRYCKLCDKEFTKRAAFQRHMDEVHRPNSVFCPVCSKSFTRKSTLLVHMRKHYEGDSGPMSLGELSRASSDGATSDSEAMYGCDLCGVSYRTAKSLRVHRVRHHGENEYAMAEEEDAAALAPAAAPGEFTCAQCGDGVATPRDLLAHRQMHATPTKFFCNICKVYFARAVDLSSHTRARHADNDKVFFPCAMCDRFYLNKKSLQRHIEMSH